MVRIAIVDKEKCRAPTDCNYICMPVCPINKTGGECITKDALTNKINIVEETCIGCNICVHKCPFNAIQIINLPEMINNIPIHRYSENGFALFGLPVPSFGKVIGVLGKNGIGKSTAIKILSGLIKPNLGEVGTEAEVSKIINYFKGTPAHKYFEDLNSSKVTVSYKPQQVELIPDQFDGTVIDLLNKVNENDKLNLLIDKLDLTNILNRTLKQISGGELQRVAIAATLLKKANVYIFDEPTSYLDIKQRIKVSDLIRDLCTEDIAILVIEHDLIALDYMTDLIYIMYGTSSAYGILSSVKSTKEGINVYLSGYIKENNMRFRDHSIKFENSAQEGLPKLGNVIDWDNIDIELGDFKLKAESGEILKSNLYGILGENGIGKSTFMRALVGDVKLSKGKINGKIKVSYKPQYLNSDSSINVLELLTDQIEQFGSQEWEYNYEIPLDLKSLYDKKLNELSGGELQRLSISICLAKDADIYLLDEPSSYLDVEQRLVTSRLIKDRLISMGKTVLVIDHDLLFVDYLCKSIIIFDGIPSKQGEIQSPLFMSEGMNEFLKILDITFRRDEENNRPRINKRNSVLDKKQRAEGNFYFI
ncbi:ribosome biogenesis/translation initiation ATPase RLI [Candidatus Woesearchaeota archaeon]|jgi:ATP-binding cassette, sub-family E, member 1|nr:ribosome biogenesis/translation initiation ATPase RLI [Candidatus Woesearchaeota archaeon]MBT4595394.1 ribosome biogenesis/translation initiation ATPase RLI [Candidatus Woesearchaeota archaeon]MBT5741201.1 ribosome biogenesis/translation initiation ATPase RLI [Candidatus Woesearchaeota archaeon]MBT7296234.1 ribosome biogenesis/translation initiation ATPase RLI [Candidatus Woesearchaeota archaeon]MBT7849660.1 ribosome biogenesis/translation initiation ATPase RLI [Candidatus Woesearchaeota arc